MLTIHWMADVLLRVLVVRMRSQRDRALGVRRRNCQGQTRGRTIIVLVTAEARCQCMASVCAGAFVSGRRPRCTTARINVRTCRQMNQDVAGVSGRDQGPLSSAGAGAWAAGQAREGLRERRVMRVLTMPAATDSPSAVVAGCVARRADAVHARGWALQLQQGRQSVSGRCNGRAGFALGGVLGRRLKTWSGRAEDADAGCWRADGDKAEMQASAGRSRDPSRASSTRASLRKLRDATLLFPARSWTLR